MWIIWDMELGRVALRTGDRATAIAWCVVMNDREEWRRYRIRERP